MNDKTSTRSLSLTIQALRQWQETLHEWCILCDWMLFVICSGLNRRLRPSNGRRCYFVTTSLIGWAQALNQLCIISLQRDDYPSCWTAHPLIRSHSLSGGGGGGGGGGGILSIWIISDLKTSRQEMMEYLDIKFWNILKTQHRFVNKISQSLPIKRYNCSSYYFLHAWVEHLPPAMVL